MDDIVSPTLHNWGHDIGEEADDQQWVKHEQALRDYRRYRSRGLR